MPHVTVGMLKIMLRFLGSLHAAEHVPFMIRPDVMENLVKIIYELRPGLKYVQNFEFSSHSLH